MAKTYIEHLIESLNKKKWEVDVLYFIDNFPRTRESIGQAFDDMMKYDKFEWMDSLRMTSIAVDEIENHIDYIKSIQNDNVDVAMVIQDHRLHLEMVQREIIKKWVLEIISDHYFGKAVDNITVDEYSELNSQHREDGE